MTSYLEKTIEEINFDDLGVWRLPDVTSFSTSKTLYPYQIEALKSLTKLLHFFFVEKDSKRFVEGQYKKQGMLEDRFRVPEYVGRGTSRKRNSRYDLLAPYYHSAGDEVGYHLPGYQFLNRAAFWMATGSGKSLVLIKTIELVDYLMSQGVIPRRDIMLLLPKDDLIRQFQKEITQFNVGRDRPIELVSLKSYDEDKHKFDFDNTIKVYVYRSDLLRDVKKDTQIDYHSYDNDGKWYVFLDEAHRGDKASSLMQDYVNILSRDGFLFNYSATFTDEIDYATTCYNFNLEKFITSGYGKNLYVSSTYFSLRPGDDEFDTKRKQRELMRSFIIYSLIKKSKKASGYHVPLMVTLVNSVNTEDADLLLFFRKLQEIASGDYNLEILDEAKKEIHDDLGTHSEYVFGDEKLTINLQELASITHQEIAECIFNTAKPGKIEILQGEKGKEIALKLQTSDKLFALIKIGDTGKFQKSQLGEEYTALESFNERKYFHDIDQNDDITILMGSRSFYEGWDSNRPNVINLINIGQKDAKKFVLQAIGRGIRIEPHKGYKKRLAAGDSKKNPFLETLFVFATDKSAINAITETIKEQKSTDEYTISLTENPNKPFDLLIPVYGDESTHKVNKFYLSFNSLKNLRNYFTCFSPSTLTLRYGMSNDNYRYLADEIASNEHFELVENLKYTDMPALLRKVIIHITRYKRTITDLKPITDEIVHFRHIKVTGFDQGELDSLNSKIEQVTKYKERVLTREEKKALSTLKNAGTFTIQAATSETQFTKNNTKIFIKNIAEHFYLPVMHAANQEKIEYINHIINVESEISFVTNLQQYISNKQFEFSWMFSKIDQSLDKLSIPYFYRPENEYRFYFPDFIFWLKKGNQYKIVFVDPKGTVNADYQNKIDEYESLFLDDGKPKIFNYQTEGTDIEITFDLKLVGNNKEVVGLKYASYWLNQNDFSFMKV